VLTFDGDEANTHSAQTLGGRVECSVISRVAFMIVSAQNNAPVMGCVQNTLICMYLLTETFVTPERENSKSTVTFEDGTKGYETFIDSGDAMASIELARITGDRFKDLLKRAQKYYPEYIKTSKTGELRLASKIPGKLLVSIVFPRNFTWSRKTGVNDRFPDVIIKNGIIMPKSGPICKKTIGGISGSAIHALWRITPNTALDVISELQFMACYMIERLGFSMGVSDILPTRLDEIKAAIDEALIKCELINSSQLMDMEDKEREINGALNEAAGVAPRLAKTSMNKGDRNSLVIMQKSGAKGSVANNGQISGFVGQQNMDGKRMKYMLCGETRTLPHFTRNDNSPESRGFVSHSYLEGLTFKEAWFHAAAGRRGVIDTAMKSVTWDTEIFIIISGKPKNVKIGLWIDEILAENNVLFSGVKTEYFEDRNMELLEIQDVKIPTCDEKGTVFWSEVTHVTRHDPSTTLYKITTQSGRSVTVTDSKAILVWKNMKLVQVNGDLVKIGDYLPVSLNTPEIGVAIINMRIYTREEGLFELNKENGLLIGLYLSSGRYRQDEGLELNVYNAIFGEAVEKWFIQNHISYECKKEVHHPAYHMYIKSLVLKISNIEKFISRWIFRLGRKTLPDEIFSAPKDFILGLLNGYFNNVGELFLSQELTIGISTLCSIAGIAINLKGGDICFRENQEIKVENDIWLDPVISIEKINGAKHKYVYDLTVPSTTNFAISNGLVVVDTADSGYLQKKITKKIEDCSIWDDGSVRDVNNSIVQFIYGGDGLSAKELIYCRGIDSPIFCDPYMIASLLNTEAEYAIEDGVDVGVLREMTKSEIDMLCSFIKSGCPGVQSEVTERATYNMKILLKSIIPKVKIYETMIPRFCSNVRDDYEGGKAKKGYMGGLIAASSMGEITTQMTLNSLDWQEIVYIRNGNKIILGPIGQFIDNIIESYPEEKIQKLPNRQLYIDVSEEDYEMTSVDEEGKMHWKKVEGVTRHLPGGKLIKVKTHFGKEVVATKGMSFLTRVNNKIVATAGSDLKIGDHLPVMLNYPETECSKEFDAFERVCPINVIMKGTAGYHVGSYLGRPEFQDKEMADVLDKYIGTQIPSWCFTAPLEFVKNLLDAYFMERAIVDINKNIKCFFNNKKIADGFSELLARVGIYGRTFYEGGEYAMIMKWNDLFERSYLEETDEVFVLSEAEISNDVYYDPIVSIEEVDCSTEWVYDFTIADTRNFSTFGGLQVRDSFHSTGMSAKDVTLGVPRLKELLSVTKNPSKPGCVVYLLDEELKLYEEKSKTDESYTKKAIERVTKLANKLVDLKVDYFVKKYELKYLCLPKENLKNKVSPINLIEYQKYEKKWWVTLAEDLGNAPAIEPESWVIILVLDLDKMYRYGITTAKIAKKIGKEAMETMGCVPSPNNIAQVEVYLNFKEIREFIGDKFSEQISESDTERKLITYENLDYFTMREVAIDLIKNTRVQGVPGITRTYIRQDLKTKEWIIDTQGTNLAELLARSEVDQTRTLSDDLWEVYNVLGLEAARMILIEEIIKILSFDGAYVNPRHITILADSMCKSAILTGANRDGISRETGPIAKGMFEKAVDNFAESAAFGEFDPIRSVGASTMMGTLPNVGTGTVEIKDSEKLPVEKKPVKVAVKKRGVVK